MKRRHWNGLPALVEDILETETGRWFTVANLVDVVLLYRPEARRETVAKAVLRVHQAPRIQLEERRGSSSRSAAGFGTARSSCARNGPTCESLWSRNNPSTIGEMETILAVFGIYELCRVAFSTGRWLRSKATWLVTWKARAEAERRRLEIESRRWSQQAQLETAQASLVSALGL